MKPWVHRLPLWAHVDRPWMVIVPGSISWFPTWAEAQHHATRIA